MSTVRTSLGVSGGRVVIRVRFRVRCAHCGTEYRPRVHAHPELVLALGAVAIAAVVVTGVLWYTGRLERTWLLAAKVFAALIVAVLGWMASRLQKALANPSFWTPLAGREPAYGEILLGCPRCRSTAATAAD